MKFPTRTKMRAYFERRAIKIFWPSDLPRILRDLSTENRALALSTQQILKFLLEEGLLVKAEFRSPKYTPIIRYVWDRPTPFQLATSLRRNSFLCHATALALHGLKLPSKLIYVNQEQTPKPPSEDVSQEAIATAFSNHQRLSKYIFKYSGIQYVLLNGKNTGRAGVASTRQVDGTNLDVTDIERTLIDVVVRPAYAGGIAQVVHAYRQMAPKVRIDYMITLLKETQYVYPYHQSIGFLLELSGRDDHDCQKLQNLGTSFDFYLDYKMKSPAYSDKWRLYYPSSLRK